MPVSDQAYEAKETNQPRTHVQILLLSAVTERKKDSVSGCNAKQHTFHYALPRHTSGGTG